MCDVFYFKAENTLFCSKCSFTQSDLVLYYSSAPPPSLSEFLSSVPFVIFTPGAFCSALIFAQLFTSLGSALSPQVELHFLQNTKFFALVQREKLLRADIQRINCLPSIWTNAYQHWQAEECRGVGQKIQLQAPPVQLVCQIRAAQISDQLAYYLKNPTSAKLMVTWPRSKIFIFVWSLTNCFVSCSEIIRRRKKFWGSLKKNMHTATISS